MFRIRRSTRAGRFRSATPTSSDFAERCARHQTQLILVELQPLTRQTLESMGVLPREGTTLVTSFEDARTLAQRLVDL